MDLPQRHRDREVGFTELKFSLSQSDLCASVVKSFLWVLLPSYKRKAAEEQQSWSA